MAESNSSDCRLVFMPSGLRGEVPPGTLLLEAAGRLGVELVFSLATTEAAPACLAQGHSRWLRFCLDRRYASTFLPPFAPSPLRDFIATMEALLGDARKFATGLKAQVEVAVSVCKQLPTFMSHTRSQPQS